ncbi:hypothetical protein IVB27_38570 [Bradyrhizobium sp. 197]|uniref:hypothetical protein n=1 Tax=Bradyrhizobium sp. 197 TaxID=2782663 RepID=UPI001FFAA798|nr:hypothetical protein [Bradyrhizobium sp. 197]MCK1480484.1 hypothetical protein [Bradyrhizobium sp. 197]
MRPITARAILLELDILGGEQFGHRIEHGAAVVRRVPIAAGRVSQFQAPVKFAAALGRDDRALSTIRIDADDCKLFWPRAAKRERHRRTKP